MRGVADRLAAAGVRCIVDHSTEESEEASARQFNLDSKVALLQTLRRELPTTCAFVPIKLTALVSPGLLEKITTAAAATHGASSAASAKPDAELRQAASTLSAAEQEELTTALEALRALCAGSRNAAMPLLLDAEQTPRQPAIRLIARTLSYRYRDSSFAITLPHSRHVTRRHTAHQTLNMCVVHRAEFNLLGAAPLVYNTHQAYLRGAEETLREEVTVARSCGYTLAVKLVRGAYRGVRARVECAGVEYCVMSTRARGLEPNHSSGNLTFRLESRLESRLGAPPIALLLSSKSDLTAFHQSDLIAFLQSDVWPCACIQFGSDGAAARAPADEGCN